MPKQYIYLVVRHSGEYEDYRTCVIAAYLDRKLARTHAKLATEALDSLQERFWRWYDRLQRQVDQYGYPDEYPDFRGGTPCDRDAEYDPATAYEVEKHPISIELPKGRQR